MHRLSPNERGAALVEFALIAPLLFALIIGIVQVTLLENRQQGLHAAAREGARLGSINGTTENEIRRHVETALDGVIFESTPSIAIVECDGGGDPDTITVTITAASSSLVPFVAGSITQSGTGSFRCES